MVVTSLMFSCRTRTYYLKKFQPTSRLKEMRVQMAEMRLIVGYRPFKFAYN